MSPLSRRPAAAARAAALAIALATPALLQAQDQRQVDVHANYSRATQTETNSWGAGTQVQLVWGSSSAPVKLGTSLGGDFLKQEAGGPTQVNTSLDGVVQLGTGGAVTPYAGGSGGANWSVGDDAQWSGARVGLEAIAGLSVSLGPSGSSPSVKAEERFGYVHGQEHALGTRLGVAFPF